VSSQPEIGSRTNVDWRQPLLGQRPDQQYPSSESFPVAPETITDADKGKSVTAGKSPSSHHLLPAQPRDLRLAVTQFAQHLVGMLSQLR